jgi:hypothetical protein
MIAWGIVSGCFAFVQGPITFVTLRFLLGLAEAGFAERRQHDPLIGSHLAITAHSQVKRFAAIDDRRRSEPACATTID